MSVSDWAAWVGAITGILALLLQGYQHYVHGPRLELFVNPNMKMVPPITQDNPTYVFVKVANNGTAKTTITHLSVCSYSSRIKLWLDKPDSPQGVVPTQHGFTPPLPHVLDVGEEWTGLILNDNHLREMGEGKHLFCRVFHSGSKKAARAKIKL